MRMIHCNFSFPDVDKTIHGLALPYEKTRIYQDGLPVCGREAEIVTDDNLEVVCVIRRAMNTRKITISGLYELIQGGMGLVARKALYVNDAFWGLVTMVIKNASHY